MTARPTQQAAREALAAHLHKLIGEYWGIAYREGVEARTQDTEDGAAARCLYEITHTIRSLAHPAPSTPPTVTDGWVMVPRRMTLEMEVAFCEQWFSKRRCVDDADMDDCWAAALAAAPPAEASPVKRKLRDHGYNVGPWTYQNQPGNVIAWALGTACRKANESPAGDPIDRGLALLRELQEEGVGVFEIGGAAPPPAVVRDDGWLPIATAPKDYRFILVAEPSGFIHIVQWCVDNFWRGNTPADWSPTHWQPLPKPPADHPAPPDAS